MGRFEEELQEIRRVLAMLDEPEAGASTEEVETCLERLGELARQVESQSKALREEAAALALRTATTPAAAAPPPG